MENGKQYQPKKDLYIPLPENLDAQHKEEVDMAETAAWFKIRYVAYLIRFLQKVVLLRHIIGMPWKEIAERCKVVGGIPLYHFNKYSSMIKGILK